MMSSAEIVGVVIGSVASSTVIAELVRNWFNRNKNRAETDNLIVQMYDKLLDDMRKDMERLKGEIDELRKRETAYIENQNYWLKKNSELNSKIEEQASEIRELNSKLSKFTP